MSLFFSSGVTSTGKDEALEEYCYRHILSCDILVAVIGGRFGTQSKDQQHSITQKELKTAIELGNRFTYS